MCSTKDRTFVVARNDQKVVGDNISQDFLDRANADENFLENTITAGETRSYGYQDTTVTVRGKRIGQTRKSRLSRWNIKVMLITFFDIKWLVHYEFVLRVFTPCCRERRFTAYPGMVYAESARKPEPRENQSCVPARASLLLCIYLAKHETTDPTPRHLDPVDFFLFLKLNTILKGHRFQTIN